MDVTEARQRALDCRRQVANGVDPQAAVAVEVASELTLRQFVTDAYLPHAYATKRSAKDDKGRMRNILPEFGDLPISRSAVMPSKISMTAYIYRGVLPPPTAILRCSSDALTLPSSGASLTGQTRYGEYACIRKITNDSAICRVVNSARF